MKTVLVTGAAGQLAHALVRTAPSHISCLPLSRTELNITDEEAITAALSRLKPSLVINCAAYNLVDRAEQGGMSDAFAANAVGPARLAAACAVAALPLVHFSTDFVFDGLQRRPYTEDDHTAPVSAYGASKLAGEHIALAASPRNLVVRVSRLFGPVAGGGSAKSNSNFPMVMLRLARDRSIRVVGDQIGSPTYTMDLAPAVWQLIGKEATGLFHLANQGDTPFDEYARQVFRLAHSDCRVESVTTAEYGAPARRPAYSTLGCDRAWAAGVSPLRPWNEALRAFIEGGEAA